MISKPIFVAGGLRTPIGSFGGSLSKLTAVELAETAVRAVMQTTGLAPDVISETFFGHARQAGCGPNPSRQIATRAGIPESKPAITVNQACASGLRAIALAAQAIELGDAEAVLAGGTESMSNTPYLLPRARWGYRMGHGELVDGMYKDGFHCPIADQLMGRTAETLAEDYSIGRDEQDRYALSSQQRALAARERLREEITPVMLTDRKGNTTPFTTDEHVRDDASIEGMAKLKPVFKEGGTVHAGNSSGITDGAAACIVLSEDCAKQNNIEPMARIVGWSHVGVDARRMGIGPVPATQTLLSKANVSLNDVDLIELNEAFAAQLLACQRELRFDLDRTNVNGGAIALGHPIGCSGTRIVVTLLHEMKRRKVRYGLATLCVSGGMGIAMLFERI